MRIYKFQIIFFCLCLSLFSLYAVDTSFAGSSKTSVEAYMPGTENQGDFANLTETLQGELDIRADDSRLFVSGNLKFDALNSRGNTSTDAEDLVTYLYSGLSGSLKEAWFDWISPTSEKGLQFGFKFGRQINAWGKADGIRIADVLCPQDLSTLSATDYTESRLGFDGLTLILSGEKFSISGYVLPFFRPSVLPLSTSNPLRRLLIPESVNNLSVTIDSIESPEISLQNTSYAFRASFWLPIMDFSVYGYYGFDDMPIINYAIKWYGITPTEIQISGNYYKYIMTGFDAAIPAGDFVFRFETAAFFNRAIGNKAEYVLLNNGEEYNRKNQLMALVGVDYTYGDWTFTAQYYEDILFNHDENCNRNFRKPGATLNISKSCLAQTLELSLTGAIMLNDFDSVISADAKYSLSDQISLNLEATEYLAGPENDGDYGQYHDLSSISISGVYKF